MPQKKKRVVIGLSGGVDSSVSAKLLQDAGYDVQGVYLECWREPGCRTDQDRKDALAVAVQLGIPYQVIDLKTEYRERVVEYFYREYEAGRTPNPDVMCNREIKFGLFYDWAMAEGFDAVATGHYAQVKQDEAGRFYMAASVDEHKDQTYFLYQLRAEQLAHVLFPIGHLPKSDVRKLAHEWQLAVADKKDSVGICFIGDVNVHNLLKDRLGENPGDVIDTAGNVIGKHTGLWFYTVGQRHGFEIFPKITVIERGESIDKHQIPPFYVIEKKAETNQLVVGFGADTQRSEFAITEPNWLVEPKEWGTGEAIVVRIRHTGKLLAGEIDRESFNVQLQTPQQGIAPGQSAVLYQEREGIGLVCLGGGVIA
jgi:tRNA-uridine 2-sulfurtransferase